jgi:hypothetical protein
MATYLRKIYRIAEILKWESKDQLIVRPKFQRRDAWEENARSYLIDTVVRNLPMPKIYLREIVNPDTEQLAYEVVDGQQRLTAIVDFHKGNLILYKKYNELGDATFEQLPEPVRHAFLEYEISTEVMQNALDEEVWAMFDRLNTYTLTLNNQERLNSQYFGRFKQTAYKLAAERSALSSWKNLKVFGDRQIARMKEVELTSDVLVAITEGISDITEIPKAYEKYDDEFPKSDTAEKTFRKSLRFIATRLPKAVRETRFKRRVWFYSLMVAMADAKVGIPMGKGPSPTRSKQLIQKRMYAMDAALRTKEPPPGLARLHGAFSRATSHKSERSIRHEQFYLMLTLPEKIWRKKWNAMTSPAVTKK